MEVAVVKYNAGNIQSLSFALNRLGVTPLITDDAEKLAKADKVIFPGQGEASTAMKYLKQKGLDRVLKTLTQPFLGVCLGMQLMCEHTEENDTKCLGLLPIKVLRFTNPSLKIPHMGWNTIDHLSGPLFEGIKENDFLYFVHSYYVEPSDYTIASATYGEKFSMALHKDNYYAIQPHPEKSADAGMKILDNFLKT
ncbi:MAG: imidazole glycerol phosphate synthase subunit HisH [Cyclobacteriaceae bacterium]